MSNVRKIAVIGMGSTTALEVAKKKLAEKGMSHVVVEELNSDDLKFEYPEPPKIEVMEIDKINSGLELYNKTIDVTRQSSKYHK